MIARRTTWLTLAVVAAAASFACVREKVPLAPRELELGAHRVHVIVPTGWEALDQGKQKRFRKGEFEIVLQNLGPRPLLREPAAPDGADPAAPEGAADIDELIDGGLAAVGHDQRRDVKSLRTVALDGREAVDIETWNRLDHTNPQRIFFVEDHGDLLALYTERMAFEDSLAAFDAIRDSLHFRLR